MTFMFQGTASGTFQSVSGTSVSFTDAPFTITATADAGDVTLSTHGCTVPSGACKIFSVPVTAANIYVGTATAEITSPLTIFVNQTYPTLGLQRRKGADLLDLQWNRAFATYELNGDLAPAERFFREPVAPAQFTCTQGCVVTSLGSLIVSKVQNVKFRASAVGAGEQARIISPH